ncbi:MAG: energy transducer TonB [Betaproteobacteria bacterium]|nr:energy transducer TonB [Betaproteobacteria bacterium]
MERRAPASTIKPAESARANTEERVARGIETAAPGAAEASQPAAAPAHSDTPSVAVQSKAETRSVPREPEPVQPPAFNAAHLHNAAPHYPLIARRNGEQGTVTLKVLVTRDGVPANVSIEKSSGSGHLDAAALESVSTWRFVPARQGAQPVEAWVLVPVVFRLEGSS